MKKLKLYIETSVWNFLFADEAPEKKKATEALFKEIEEGKYSLFISEIVVNEINKAPIDKQELLAGEIHKYKPVVLEDSDESQELVSYYLRNGLLTENQMADLGHVAIATVNEMDILASWNMRHIVKRRTRTMVNALNQLRGYRTLDICTPEEAIEL